jgi:hypothetical protein
MGSNEMAEMTGVKGFKIYSIDGILKLDIHLIFPEYSLMKKIQRRMIILWIYKS